MRVRTWDEFYAAPRSLPDMLRCGLTHQRLVTELAGVDRVLEIGTGSGILSALVAKLGPRTVTLDNNGIVLENAQEFFSAVDASVSRVRGDAFHLPFREDAFGACYSQGLLEHFSDAEVVGLVAEQVRVSPVVYASVPSAFYPRLGRRGPGLIGNERLLTLRRWRRILGHWDVQGCYYADFQVASLAGRTLPLPVQILLRVARPG